MPTQNLWRRRRSPPRMRNEEEEGLKEPNLKWRVGVADPHNAEEAAEAQKNLRAEERYPEPHEAVRQQRDLTAPDEEP